MYNVKKKITSIRGKCGILFGDLRRYFKYDF